MIFADKLIRLRKRCGWSQEELAEQMRVSRQTVSKWESAQSIPDLEKIIRLSALFGVSTDYLLKDEIETDDAPTVDIDDAPACRRVSMEEASAFLAVKAETAKPIALAVLLFILSPVCLLLLAALSATSGFALSENAAGGLGMLVLVAVGVAICIASGGKTSPYAFLEKEAFETEYGVVGMVESRKKQYHPIYLRANIIGVSLCILSLVPLFVGVAFSAQGELLLVSLLCLMFVLVGVGVMCMVRAGIVWASFEKLLQEGDYSARSKRRHSAAEPLSTVYWLLTTAIYLLYSFSTNAWHHTWIVWPIAALLYAALLTLLNTFAPKE